MNRSLFASIRADVNFGKFCRLFAPLSPSNSWSSFSVRPSGGKRSIPKPPLLKMELDRKALPVPESSEIPLSPLKAMVLQALSQVPGVTLSSSSNRSPTRLSSASSSLTPAPPLLSSNVASISVPMKLPWTLLAPGRSLTPMMNTPCSLLPAMTLAAPSTAPPIRLSEASSILMPLLPLLPPLRNFLPVTSVPMKLPCTLLPKDSGPNMTIPWAKLPEITLRDSSVVPPIRLSFESMIRIPAPKFG